MFIVILALLKSLMTSINSKCITIYFSIFFSEKRNLNLKNEHFYLCLRPYLNQIRKKNVNKMSDEENGNINLISMLLKDQFCNVLQV